MPLERQLQHLLKLPVHNKTHIHQRLHRQLRLPLQLLAPTKVAKPVLQLCLIVQIILRVPICVKMEAVPTSALAITPMAADSKSMENHVCLKFRSVYN